MSEEKRKEKKEEKKSRREERKQLYDGCGVTGMLCDGECREHHYRDCQAKFKFYYEPIWKTRKPTEENPKPKKVIKGYRKVDIK